MGILGTGRVHKQTILGILLVNGYSMGIMGTGRVHNQTILASSTSHTVTCRQFKSTTHKLPSRFIKSKCRRITGIRGFGTCRGGPEGSSRGGPEGVKRGSRGGPEGNCRSGVDARETQNPTKSEEYQKHLQGGFQGVWYSTRGVQRGSRGSPEGVQRGFIDQV
eukprot:526323-Prorocentrum_minimum.AAC.1